MGCHQFITTPQATGAWGSGLVAGILWAVLSQSASGACLSIWAQFLSLTGLLLEWRGQTVFGIAGRRKWWVGSKSARARVQDAGMTFGPGAQPRAGSLQG